MNEQLQTLLWQQLAARSGLDAGASPQEMLAQLGQQGQADPVMNLLTQYLTQRQTDAASAIDGRPDADEGEDEAVIEPVASRLSAQRTQKMAQAVTQLRQKFTALYQELEELREKNDALAEALGACHLCWGEDTNCQICRGQGRSGANLPDRKLFAQLVAPALRRLAKQERAPQQLNVGAAALQLSNQEPNERKAL
jgi:hypothetical protein